MIIENPDTFKSWLTTILEPLCDADPAALAKYVYALVKKEKPLDELREGMLDQLDVFLQEETKPFVDMLFKSLETCEYLKSAVPAIDQKQPSPAPQIHEETEKVAEVEPEVEEAPGTTVTMNGTSEEHPTSRPTSPARPRVLTRNVRPRPPQEQTLVKVLPLNELLEEPLDPEPKRRDRRMPDSLRDKEDRRRRPRGWDRRNRRRDEPIRHDVRRPGSRSPSPRRGYRNRSPPPLVDRPLSRSRSRSPLPPPRKRIHERLERRRSLSRDRASRDRDHRERTMVGPRDRSRSRSLTPIDDRERLSPIGPAYKRRCRDFDVKGYCMRGDLCVWDHGTDPLVLEDTTLSRALTIPPPPPPEYNPMSPQIWSAFPAPPPGFLPPPPRPTLVPPPPHPSMPAPPRALVPLPRIRENVPPHMMHQMPPRLPPPNKKNFDFTRLGGLRPTLTQSQANCSLEVKKVPRGLNDITHLNNHFSKFGKIVNIQVSYEGDPEAALITFSNHIEANIAYKSTEAVLNNRFIKVFWHNPESKQENVPPAKIAERPASQHPDSNNKQLINNNNVKATLEARGPVAPAAVVEKPKEPPTNGQIYTLNKKEPAKPQDKTRQVMEMHKRAQTLLETQLQQQTLLIHKLESGQVTGPQKAALMEAINSAQEGIEKLRKELVAYNTMIQQIKANTKRPKTREEAQKEILDAELDMFTKQQEGADVTELSKRIAELRRAMSIQFPTHPPVRRPIHSRGGARFNTATRFVRNNLTATTPKVFVNQSVDHRPRALLVSGFEADEVDGLVKHFTQFGEITAKELNLAVPEFTVQFKARGMAEQAMLRGKNYNERTLTITWVTSNKPITPVTPAAGPTVPQNNAQANGSVQEPSSKDIQQSPQANMITEDTLLRFDEEEDDDNEEDRTWRR